MEDFGRAKEAWFKTFLTLSQGIPSHDTINRVLRAPMGLSLYDEDLESEVGQQHFGVFDDTQNLVACGIAVLVSPTAAQIRQMAVSVAHQQQGYGRQILCGIEDRLAASGQVHVSLHARMSAMGFYEKLGYAKIGEEFIEVGIPHIRMGKRIWRMVT